MYAAARAANPLPKDRVDALRTVCGLATTVELPRPTGLWSWAMQPSDMALLLSLDALLQENSVSSAARRVGLSTPAMSHTLARIRERLCDPILVRSGRGMLLTPRAEFLKPLVHNLVDQATRVLQPERPFVPQELSRTFVIHATDYVLTVLGGEVARRLREQAPNVCLRFVPNTVDDAICLRDHDSDLAVGIYGDLPQEMRCQRLLTDRFVCAVREEHPLAEQKLTLERFVDFPHIQIAPRGKPGGYVDDMLREHGLSRVVLYAVPYFLAALQLSAQTDCLLTISERLAKPFAARFSLKLLKCPLPLEPYALSLLWHPRLDRDAGHRFLREQFLHAAQTVTGPQHKNARSRLDPSDPTSGQARKRFRSRSKNNQTT